MHIHGHPCTFTYIHVHPRTSMYIHLHPCTSTYIHVHPCTPMYILVYPRTSLYIHVHPCTSTYIHVHPSMYMHVHPTVCISLSPYLIPLLIAASNNFPAPYHVSYFFLCPSHSFFYLSVFLYILGLVALSVSGWSACSCLVAVIFLSPRNTRFPVTPDFPFLASKYSCCSFAPYGLFVLFLSIAVPRAAAGYIVHSGTVLLATLRNVNLCSPGVQSPQLTVHDI